MGAGYGMVLKLLEKYFGKRGAKTVVCLVLMVFGITHTEIQKKQGAALSTLRRYRTALENENIDDLFTVAERERQHSELDAFESLVLEDFNANPPGTLRAAQTRIESLTKIKLSLHRLNVWLKKKGLRSLAVGFVGAKADPEKQKTFRDDTLLPLIESAKMGLLELFFMDASHFVMGGFLGRVWSTVRRYVKTSSGRQRYNVLGAINFVSKEMKTICNKTYITSVQVVEVLEQLAAAYSLPIHIVLDNASYQACNFVKDAAKRLGITLHFLPTYSPNLNLIERVWKHVKSNVLNAAYFETFENFCGLIDGCISKLHTVSKTDMERLITSNFHIVEQKLFINK